jgi:hypothetical protein
MELASEAAVQLIQINSIFAVDRNRRFGQLVSFSRIKRLLWFRKRSNPLFDARWYLRQYPDVAASGIDPFLHYLLHGASEGRDPNPLFDTDWYLAQNPDVCAAAINPLEHFLALGAAEGRDPHPLFSIEWYIAQNPSIDKKKTNPLLHYLRRSRAISGGKSLL